jgi:GNAT superfamily N-acetyltransferase
MYTLRPATTADLPTLNALISESVRGLNAGLYTDAEIEASLIHVFGVDTQLIADGTYYVIEDDGVIAAAGGWSGRRTLFGGDQMKRSDDDRLDPAREPARIRAFFVHPHHARRGLARRLYEHCAGQARAAGFRKLELASTLPGVPLYTALGFVAHERIESPMPGGLVLACIRMDRLL